MDAVPSRMTALITDPINVVTTCTCVAAFGQAIVTKVSIWASYQTNTDFFFLFFCVSTTIHSKFAFISTYVFYIDPRYIQGCNQLSMNHLPRGNRRHYGNDHMCQCSRIHRFGLNMLKCKY